MRHTLRVSRRAFIAGLGAAASLPMFGFDRAAVTAGLAKLGAKVIASPDEPGVLRFRDLDGISLELKAV